MNEKVQDLTFLQLVFGFDISQPIRLIAEFLITEQCTGLSEMLSSIELFVLFKE